MNSEILFTLHTLYRQPLDIRCLAFGSGEKAAAVVGSLRGNEVQQLYICSQLVQALSECERSGRIAPGRRISVIPCVNLFSMNLGKRFWAADNTDINRMFPGYDKGETTQRIAAALFEHLKGFAYGIQFTSYYLPGNFVPHVRLWDTGYQEIELTDSFGLPFVMLSKPSPIDTGTLNYNWQIFGTQAFSVYSQETKNVHERSAAQAVQATLDFLTARGILTGTPAPTAPAYQFMESDLVNVLSESGGIFLHKSAVGQTMAAGGELADILDPYTGAVQEHITAPCSGRIFFTHNSNLIGGHEIVCRMIPKDADGHGGK